MKYRSLLPALLGFTVLLSACNKNDSAGGAAPGAAKNAAPTGPVATVGGEAISGTLFDFYARNRTGKPASELKAEDKQQLLDQLINLQVAADTAVKNGLDKENDNAARLELLRMNALADMEIARKLGDQRPTDQEMRAEYERLVAQLPALEYHLSLIQVATEEFAQSLIARIKGGANFTDVARKESMHASKEKGGDLSWVNPRNGGTEFSKVVEALKKGEMTDKPIKTDAGYYIVRVEDTRPMTPIDYEQVKTQLAQRVQESKIKAYVDELKKGVKIEKKI